MKVLILLLSFIIGSNAYPLHISSQEKISGNLIPVKKIPGTSLYTGIFYKVGMKKYPNGWVTYTDRDVKDKDGSYVQIDLNPNNLPFYKPGEKWENEIQWAFEPSEQEGYYTLRNKGIPNGLVTSRKETETGYNHVIIAKKPELVNQLSVGGSLRKYALVKPIQGSEDGKMYQLKFQKFPEDTVTWTETKYGDHSHYLQVSDNPNHKAKYQKGGVWYDDSLFEFIPTSDIELEGLISHFELTDSTSTILDKYEKHTKRTEVKKLTIENTTPTTGQEIIKETIETEHDITLSFTENLKVFKNIKMSISLPTLNRNGLKSPDLLLDSFRLATNSVNYKQSGKVIVSSDIETPPKSTLEISIVKDTLENVDLPFRALVVVQGTADRMTADHSGVVKGITAPETTMKALEKAGFRIEGMRIVQDSLLVWVTGNLKGSIVIGTGVNLSQK